MALRYISRDLRLLFYTAQNSILALNTSFDPNVTLSKLKAQKWTPVKVIWTTCNALLAAFWVSVMPAPLKFLAPTAYCIALLLPITSQFFIPASPVLMWVLTYFTSRYLPPQYRPGIAVSLLTTLESVLYGANISDILTRYTHPILDMVAWIPYGVGHFSIPFVIAIFLWLFRQRSALYYWAFAFGYMNLFGVICQILLPCAPPCMSCLVKSHSFLTFRQGTTSSTGQFQPITACSALQVVSHGSTGSSTPRHTRGRSPPLPSSSGPSPPSTQVARPSKPSSSHTSSLASLSQPGRTSGRCTGRLCT